MAGVWLKTLNIRQTDRQTEKMTPHLSPLPSAMEPSAVSWWHTMVSKWVGLPQNRKGGCTGTFILWSQYLPLHPSQTKTQQQKENYRPISLMSIDAKINILLTYFVNWTQDFIKITHHDQVCFNLEMQIWSNICKSINVVHYINRLKDRNYRTILEATWWLRW